MSPAALRLRRNVSSRRAPSGVVIRRSTPADLASFRECLDAVARERRFLALVEAPPLAEARTFLEEARARGMVQFVAVIRSRVVGWCDVSPNRLEGFRHSASLGMGVLAQYRGRTLGARLLVETLAAARAQGLTRIELEVFRSNRHGVALYRRHGFVEEGVKRQACILDGRVEDLVCMALLITA